MHTSSRSENNSRKSSSKRKTIDKEHLSLKFLLRPLNFAQEQCIDSFNRGLNIFAYGSAGTGKTMLACYLALQRLFAGEIEKIIIVRSTVAVRDSGFLPGSLDEKADPYKAPYKALVNELCGNGTAWDILVKKGLVEFITTSYIRGITISDAVVIIDEVQNHNWEECYSTLTRPGKNTQIFLIGDGKQNDLQYKKNDSSCISNLVKVIQKMPDEFDIVTFVQNDIVRSSFVKSFICACEDLGL